MGRKGMNVFSPDWIMDVVIRRCAKLGWNCRELAGQAGIPYTTLHGWWLGRYEPTHAMAALLLRTVGVKSVRVPAE